jgi:NAD(P)-dependent dehydrogenase (short-subunit alcohol dehydrogenase family)
LDLMVDIKINADGRLAGKTALIAGAASNGPGTGIGQACAILFANEGAKLVLVNRSRERAQALCDEINHRGGHCTAVVGDVTNEEDVKKITRIAIETYGRIDILLNNAGSGAPGTVTNLKKEIWDIAININLTAPMLTSRNVVPHMIEAGGGSIINISTLAAVQGFHRCDTGFTPYSASKAGLIGLTRAIAADYAHQGVRANCLVVGMVNTPALAKFGEDAREKRRQAVPLKVEGTAWDVAWSAVYLASDESRWVTGIEFPVDGGQLNLCEWPG